MVTPSSGSRPIDRTHCIDAVPDHVPPPMLIQQSTSIDIVSQQKNPNVGNMFDNRFSHELPNTTESGRHLVSKQYCPHVNLLILTLTGEKDHRAALYQQHMRSTCVPAE
nr:hypothetical protein [Tanacetum cinerariifolium]